MRGTFNTNEDIDQELSQTEIIKDRLATLPNGETFAKQDADMRQVTALYTKCFQIDKKTKATTYLNPALTKEELTFLYELNTPIEGFGYEKDPRIQELKANRDVKADLSLAIGVEKTQISITKEEALKGNIKYHYGYLYLQGLTSAEGLTLPQTIGGDLDLQGLTSAEGLVLPQTIGGYLNLEGLTSAERQKLKRTHPHLRIIP